MHQEEGLGQAPGGVDLTDALHPGSIRSQATMGSESRKQVGPAIQPQVDDFGPSALLALQASQEHQNEEWELQEDSKGILATLI